MTLETESTARSEADSGPRPDSEPKSRRRLTRQEYVDGILSRNRSVLAHAITLIESARPVDRDLAEDIVDACLPHCGRALRIGITGVPGAGKSTLIGALGTHIIAEYEQSIAVLAVDPTSEVTGGSILGDRTRMPCLAASEAAFIRPSPSRGFHGGVAQHTREVIMLCEAAGYENIVVETVGTGQSETAVHEIVDFVVLVMLAGAGDELQGIKRGLIEVADLIAINKADGENLAAAERARSDAELALHFFPARSSGWTPRAFACSALNGQGIANLWNAAREYFELARSNGSLEQKRREQWRRWLRDMLDSGLAQMFRAHPLVREQLPVYERDVLEGRKTPPRAARSLLEIYAGAVRARV